MEWREIEECPGYSVSDQGTVRNDRTGRELKPYLNQRGRYPTVSLWDGGRHLTRTVHGLVARAFLGPRPPGYQVRHLDGNAANATLDNLAYGTVSENRQDSVKHGTHPMVNRTHCPQGHEYTEDNTAYTTRGGRLCRECQRRHKREHARRRRAEKKV